MVPVGLDLVCGLGLQVKAEPRQQQRQGVQAKAGAMKALGK